MLSPHHRISSAEIVEILGITWKEFLEWKKEGLPEAVAPWGGVSLAEEDWWYLGVILRRYPRSQLADELRARYEGKVLRKNGRRVGAADSPLSGIPIRATDLAEMMGVKWKTFLMMESQPEFPECDSPNKEGPVRDKWWWATTIVGALPDSKAAVVIWERYEEDLATGGLRWDDDGADEGPQLNPE